MMNIFFLIATFFMVLSFQPVLGEDMTRLILFSQLAKVQVMFNIPMVIILNLSGCIKRSLDRNTDDE
jgi:hypothetical protein